MSAARPSATNRFVLTGPTGWIGRAMLAKMHALGDPDALGADDRLALFGSRQGTIVAPDGPELEIRSLANIGPADVAGAHVIHLAYLTKDKMEQHGVDQFHRINTAIDDALLDAIAADRPASLFVASSGAAQLAEDGRDAHPYGLAKLEQERRFLAWAEKSGVPTLCGRIFNLAGPHINKLESYAVSNFALQAMRGGPIRIEAKQPVFRSFLHVDDLCGIILRAARLRIRRDRPIDLCGTEVLEMQDIAEMVSAAVGGDIPIERPALTSASKSVYLGSGQDTRELALELGLNLARADVQVRDSVSWMHELNAISMNCRVRR